MIKKCYRIFFPFLYLAALLASCAVSEPVVYSNGSAEQNSPWEEPLFNGTADIIETVSITSLSVSEASEEIELIETEIFNTADQNLIHDLIMMFGDWSQALNLADSAIDGPPNYNIHFDDKVTISYFYPGNDLGYICLIQNKYFYLPEVFGKKIDQLVFSSCNE